MAEHERAISPKQAEASAEERRRIMGLIVAAILAEKKGPRELAQTS